MVHACTYLMVYKIPVDLQTVRSADTVLTFLLLLYYFIQLSDHEHFQVATSCCWFIVKPDLLGAYAILCSSNFQGRGCRPSPRAVGTGCY